VKALTSSTPKQGAWRLYSLHVLFFLILLSVHLDYRNFIPSGRAWVGFTNSEKTEQALQVLRNSVIAGHTIRAQKTDEQNLVNAGLPPRTRGPRGRAQAQERGLASGNGPDAKLINRQKNVYMWGLPGRVLGPELVKLFEPYGLRVTDEEPRSIQKLERYVDRQHFSHSD
jgi:RNA recognition motif-containing protein